MDPISPWSGRSATEQLVQRLWLLSALIIFHVQLTFWRPHVRWSTRSLFIRHKGMKGEKLALRCHRMVSCPFHVPS